MTQHITAEYVESFKELYHGTTDRKRQHEELGKVREKKDEAGVVKIMYRVMQQWNPFDIDTLLGSEQSDHLPGSSGKKAQGFITKKQYVANKYFLQHN